MPLKCTKCDHKPEFDRLETARKHAEEEHRLLQTCTCGGVYIGQDDGDGPGARCIKCGHWKPTRSHGPRISMCGMHHLTERELIDYFDRDAAQDTSTGCYGEPPYSLEDDTFCSRNR